MVLCQKWAGQGKQNSTLKEIGETWTRMPRLDQGLSWLERWGQHLHWSAASSGSAWSLEYASHLSKTTLTSPGHVALHDVPLERPGCLLCWGEDLPSADAWASTVHYPLQNARRSLQAVSIHSDCPMGPAAPFRSSGFAMSSAAGWVSPLYLAEKWFRWQEPCTRRWVERAVVRGVNYSPNNRNIMWNLVKEWDTFPLMSWKKSIS